MILGSHMTDEQRARVSAAHIGHAVSDETLAKMSAAMMGRKLSAETRARMSAAQIGNKSAFGCRRSDETRVKMSTAHMGHTTSPETRAKLSAAKKGKTGSLAGHWKGGKRMWKANGCAKHRLLGFVPLNSWFVGSEGHHMDHDHVLYIPKKLNQSIAHNVRTGKNMDKINSLATQCWMSQVMRTGHTLPVGG